MSDALVEAEEFLLLLPDAVSRRTLGERLSKAIIELKTAGHQIQRIAALLAIADLTAFGKAAHQQKVFDGLVECSRSVGEALEDAEDPEALRLAMFEYSNDLKQAIALLEQSVRDHWRGVANERFQPLIGLGELLTDMGVANELGPRLAACGRSGMSSANSGSAVDLHGAVSLLSAEYDTLQAERAAEIGEDEVGEFINALADKRATLAMVTPKVRAWLDQHAALERLGITTR